MNSGYSVLLSCLFSSTSLFEDCIPIFWRSPCWDTLLNGEPILTTSPAYNKHKESPQFFQSASDTGWSTADYERCKGITATLLESTLDADSQVNLQELSRLNHLNSPVGLACASTCLRLLPESNISGRAHYLFVSDILLKLVCALQYFTVSRLASSIEFFLPSETVYQSYALVDFFARSGAIIPLLYSADSPICISQKHLDSPTRRSPRNHARREASSSLHRSVDLSQWMQRYQLNSPVNNAGNDQQTEVHTHGLAIARRAGARYSYIPMQTLSQNLTKTIQLVFFLHAITDGPYLHGYSGYLTPYDFYEYLIQSLSQSLQDHPYLNKDDITLTFKLHPNLLHGSNSPYQSHQQRSNNEISTTSELVVNLLSISQTLGFETCLLSPLIPNKYLLAHPGFICITHHGTVAAESIALSAPVITTSLAYLPDTLNNSNSTILFADQSEDIVNDLSHLLSQSYGLKRHLNREDLPSISSSLGQQSPYLRDLLSYLGNMTTDSQPDFDRQVFDNYRSWPYFFSTDSPLPGNYLLPSSLFSAINRSFSLAKETRAVNI